MRTILIHRSPFTHLTFAAGAALMLVCASVCSAGVTFTTNTVINAGDTSYDGLDIVVTNCTVTANAAHTFASLQIVGGGVLTHSPAPNGETTNRLDLTISGALVIDAASRIDVSGMGFASGSAEAPTGNPTLGAGGSYGGLGANVNGTANLAYGDYRNPNEFGTGNSGDVGVSGGGLARITASSAQIDGGILANGAWTTAGNSGGASGGGDVARRWDTQRRRGDRGQRRRCRQRRGKWRRRAGGDLLYDAQRL